MRTKLIAAAVASALTVGIVGPALAHDYWRDRAEWQRHEDWRRHHEWQRQREWERQRAWEHRREMERQRAWDHRREVERQRALERERAAHWRHRGEPPYPCDVKPRNIRSSMRYNRDCR